MEIVTYAQYSAEVVKCDWCKKDVERKKTKFWFTGFRLCPECHKEEEDRHNKFIEEFRKEMNKGALFFGECRKVSTEG